MNFLLELIVFCFGLIIGSFLNVVILRKNKKPLSGRSACSYCGKKLGFFELVPVLSFIFQKGKCRACYKKISWQYPLVELITAFLFFFSWKFYFLKNYNLINFDFLALFDFFSLLLIFSLLIIIFVYDFQYKLIPDEWNFSFAGVALLRVFFLNFNGFSWDSFIWAGFILATPFVLLWLISKGEWLGLGDAKLALGIGWFLGLLKGSSAIILGVWLGAFVSLFLIFLSKFHKQKRLSFLPNNLTIKSEVPFAPFLISGTILIFFFSWNVWLLGF